MPPLINMSGQVFGKLTVVSRHENNRNTSARWVCKCECGRETIALTYDLRSGKQKSCGCSRKGDLRSRNFRHGRRRDPEYSVWLSIVQRCTNPKNSAWPRYGGNGITICPEWRASYVTFISEMGPRPFDGATVERIDNSQGYSPMNCKWATRKEQNNNKHNNRFVEYRGEKMTLATASEYSPVRAETVGWRLDRGWPVEAAVETPAYGVAVAELIEE